MNIFTLATIIALLTLAIGALFMWVMIAASRVVTNNAQAIERQDRERKSVNPKATGGFPIPANAEYERQLAQARELAAARAAQMPRGANMRIGRLDTTDAHKNKKVASKGVKQDPITAVKIAKFHTWNGLTISKQAAAAPVARAAGAATKQVKRSLVAGRDYAYTDVKGLSGADKRRAIIANAKAKAAAYKALKASGQDMMTVAADAPAARAAAPVAAAPSVALPPAPQLVKITDDMPADEIRKARINNSKAKSAYNKQLKDAGIDPSDIEWTDDGPVLPSNVQALATAAAPVAAGAVAAVAAGPVGPAVDLPPAPDMIAIRDDMSADEIRKARINNSKAKSAYNKQLKEMGIDPGDVEWVDDVTPRLATAVAAVAAPVMAAAPAAPAAPQNANLPPKPDLIAITDDMDPNDVRQARIQNAKTVSAYKKQLKDMGIDPSTVDI